MTLNWVIAFIGAPLAIIAMALGLSHTPKRKVATPAPGKAAGANHTPA